MLFQPQQRHNIEKLFTVLTRSARLYDSGGVLLASSVVVTYHPAANASRCAVYGFNGADHRVDDMEKEEDGFRVTLTSKLAGWQVAWDKKATGKEEKIQSLSRGSITIKGVSVLRK